MNLIDGKIGSAAARVWSCRGTYRDAQPQRPQRLGRRHITLTGQRSRTDERERPSKRFGLMLRSRRATSRSGGLMVTGQRKAKISAHHVHNLGNPCADKVRPHRARQLFL